MNYKQFGNIDIQVLESITEVLKFSDPNSVKASIILNRIRTILGVKKLDSVPDLYEALKAALPALQGIFDVNDNRPKHIKDRINLAVEALAKAEGK